MPRQIDHGEQQVADLGRGGRVVTLGPVELGFDLVGFFTDLAQDRARIVPIEADFARFGLQFQRTGQGRERHGHAGEGAFISRCPFSAGLLLGFLGFDAFPKAFDSLRRVLVIT